MLNDQTPKYDMDAVQQLVANGMEKLRPYYGPSRIWSLYQDELDVGLEMIEKAVKNLPANKENATYIWSLVLKLCKKLTHDGVDDSDGTVGYYISALVEQCGRYAKEQPELKPMIQKFSEDDTDLGFEDELRLILDQLSTNA